MQTYITASCRTKARNGYLYILVNTNSIIPITHNVARCYGNRFTNFRIKAFMSAFQLVALTAYLVEP